MAMHNPPGIREGCLRPHGLRVRALAESLGIAPSTIARIINSKSAVSPEMALRLAKTLDRSPES
jgi:addiction module HigA family antidote